VYGGRFVMALIKTYKELEIWKRGMDLTTMVYSVSSKLPDEEKYGLLSQMRRSAISIPSNIAEGSARNSIKEFIQFLYITLGSLAELETQLLICERLGLMSVEEPLKLVEEIRRKTLNYIKYLKTK
jgi:four helix bundle protein